MISDERKTEIEIGVLVSALSIVAMVLLALVVIYAFR